MTNEIDIKELETLLIRDGKINCLPYSKLSNFSQEQITNFCHKHAIYQLPTQELIDFINKHIGGLPAIEIGSGNGCIGRALGIKMTDNKMQNLPEIKLHYAMFQQPTITYGEDVEEIDGIEAVKKYHPKVVVACWVTQKYREGEPDGNYLGVDEELLFEYGVEKYILVGNEKTHASKRILDIFPVRKFKHNTIISRSMDKDKNIVYIFTKK